MIAEGLGLMAAGMGMVFAFLILLVFVMTVSAKLFSHFPDSPGKDITRHNATKIDVSHKKLDLEEIAAAIAAAKARMQD